MKVMRLEMKAFKMLGIISSDEELSWIVILNRILCFGIPIIFSLPLILYFLYNFTDIAKSTNAFYLICVTGMATSTYSEHWLKRNVIFSFINRFQMIVDGAPVGYQQSYKETDSFTHKLLYFLYVLAFVCVFGAVSLPLCFMIVMWLIGNNPEDVRILPAALQFVTFLDFRVICPSTAYNWIHFFTDCLWMSMNGQDIFLAMFCVIWLLISVH